MKEHKYYLTPEARLFFNRYGVSKETMNKFKKMTQEQRKQQLEENADKRPETTK